MANINKNIIMQAGAAVANAANKAAGLSAATPEPGSIISVIQLVNGGRTIGPDARAHLTESVRNKLLSLLVTLEPIQDFNGFDHPWPAGGGVNILPPPTSATAGSSGTITNDNGFLTISTTGENVTFTIQMPEFTFAESGQKIELLNSFTNGTVYFLNGNTQVDYFSFSSVNRVVSESSMSAMKGKTINKYRITVNAQTLTNATFALMVTDSSASALTEFSPYSNICPISGRTGLHAYAGPTDSIGDAETYSMNWTSPAGTVYAGSADIVTGDIKSAPYYASYNGETLVGPWVSSMDVYDQEGTPTTGAQVVDLGGTMTEYHITGQDIITLVGDNYIWSDSGDVTIKE